MDEVVPDIRKKNGGWEVDYDKNAPIIIHDQPTKKNEHVTVDMGLRLVPVKIRYKDGGKFTEEQVKTGMDALQKEGCKLCERSEQSVAKMINILFAREGVQPLPSEIKDDDIDMSGRGILGFRKKRFLGNRGNGILGNVVNRNQSETKVDRVFSIQDLFDIRPRILDMFRMTRRG